jgi:hypothetical protein
MGNAFCCHELYDEEELQRRHPSIALVTKRFETLETPAPAIPGILPHLASRAVRTDRSAENNLRLTESRQQSAQSIYQNCSPHKSRETMSVSVLSPALILKFSSQRPAI